MNPMATEGQKSDDSAQAIRVKFGCSKSRPLWEFALLGFRLLCSSGPCVRVEKGFSTCTGTRVADCSWVHYAHIDGQSSQPGEAPPDLSACVLALAVRRSAHIVAVD